MPESIVTIDNLGKRFGKKTALSGVTAELAPGDVVGLLGRNGAGKTTLLEVLLGFSPASTGSVTIFGENCYELSQSTKDRIGFVAQQDELLNTLSAKQQLAIAAAFHARWDEALVARVLDEWQIPLDRRIHAMSVGERQKLSVLLALGHHPDLLVLDEPVASLDPIARRQFLHELFEAPENPRRAVLFSSHIVSDLERAANKVWILKDGRLHWQGNIDALKETVVRVHVHAESPLPASLDVVNALTYRVSGNHATAAIVDWTPGARDALAVALGASIEVEPLSLEEIFVELHR
jgi:ABC-2 type transport system ATP-binding protein